MSRIRSSRTKVELAYKSKNIHLEYQPKDLLGKPDFIDWGNKLVIFIDGCFWHKCPKCYVEPKSNKSYWIPKLERNIIRGGEVGKAYKVAGWKVRRIWACELKKINL